MKSLLRPDRIRDFDVRLPPAAGIPQSRLASLARDANSAKASAVSRLRSLKDLDAAARDLAEVVSFARPADDVFYRELLIRYTRVRRYLPTVLKHLRLQASSGGRGVMQAVAYLEACVESSRCQLLPPLGVMAPAWKLHVQPDGGPIDARAYVFCTLDRLRHALKRREVIAVPGWRSSACLMS